MKYELVIIKQAEGSGILSAPVRLDLKPYEGKDKAVTLGREEKCTIMISSDSRISRQHCMIWREKNKIFVKDLRSLNKTYLNGVQLSPDKDYPFAPGQVLTMGSTVGTSRVTLESIESPLTVVPTLDGFNLEEEQSGYTLDAKINLKDFQADDVAILKGRLKWLFETSHAMSNARSLGEIVETCLDQLMSAFGDACHALIVLYSRKGELPTVIKRNALQEKNYAPEGLASARFRANDTWDTRELKLSHTILNRVKNEKLAFWINAKDLKTITTFKSAIGSETFNKINAVMASPLLSGDKNLGMIQLFSYKVFNDEDVNILRLLSAQTALIVRNIELAFSALEEQQRRESLQRYFAPNIAEGLLNGSLKAKLGGELRTGTIFYSDICGFTRLSSDMRPEDVVGLLNRYFNVMQQLVFRRGGSVDKCAGDQIMAFWGVLGDQADYAAHAVTAGIEMQIALFEFNRDEPVRSGFALPPGGLAHGIGLHTGKVCAGNIGGSQKIEFTVIGDVVNVANRIESAAGRGQVFVSESTWMAIAARAFGFKLPPVSMRNVRQCPALISVRGIVPPGVSVANFQRQEMLLNMPCDISFRMGKPVGAVATGVSAKADGKAVFVLQTDAPLAAGSECVIEWKLPETKRFLPIKGKVLRSEMPPHLEVEENAVPLASDVRCGVVADEARLAAGTSLIEVPALPAEWQELRPMTLWESDYKSEHEIIR